MSTVQLSELRRNAPAQTPPPSTGMSLSRILELPKERQFPAMLESFKKQIAMALPAHLTPDRMARLALTAFSQNPKLAACDPRSVFSSVILSAQLGLEIGVDGQAFIVPYKDQATFIPGWKGLVELVNRAKAATVWTGAVFVGDEFEWQLGAKPDCRHKSLGKSDEVVSNLTYAYAIGWIHGSQFPVIEVWSKERVIRHRNKFNKVGDKHYSYNNDASFIAYARKVPLLQVLKYMPKSVELRTALHVSENEAPLDLRDVIEGDFTHIHETAHDASPQADNENNSVGEASPSGSGASGAEAPHPSPGDGPTDASEPPPPTASKRRVIE